jgi:large subunit ribosomal protein L24e
MVVKRQCAFCAGEIEPGRGLMYVKRDGSVFFFCSGTCRKHQVTYHRVGHRLKWTRAHSLRKLSTRVSSPIPKAASKPAAPSPGEASSTPPPVEPSPPESPPPPPPTTPSQRSTKGSAPARAGRPAGTARTRATKKPASTPPEGPAPTA